jgi:tRNA threonylcarbamoyladenosine biosynthesis protein TsaE
MIKVITNSPEETINLGIKLGEKIKEPLVILLDGNLAAGKTTFTKD